MAAVRRNAAESEESSGKWSEAAAFTDHLPLTTISRIGMKRIARKPIVT
jgi:hypothetical protein